MSWPMIEHDQDVRSLAEYRFLWGDGFDHGRRFQENRSNNVNSNLSKSKKEKTSSYRNLPKLRSVDGLLRCSPSDLGP